MSFRKNWLPNLVTSGLQLLAGALIFKQQVQPWVENLISLPRDRLVRVAGYLVGLSILVFALLRISVLVPACRALAGKLYRRVALPVRRRGDLTPKALDVAPPPADWTFWDEATDDRWWISPAPIATNGTQVGPSYWD